LERLSEKQRADVLRNVCRQCPWLEHVRLAHDQQAVKLLKEVLAQPVGLTLGTGSSDPLRTFVITALGYSAAQMTPVKTVCGLDIHKPDLVAVHRVLYFWEPGNAATAAGDVAIHEERPHGLDSAERRVDCHAGDSRGDCRVCKE
jgi:hypothetical protein